MPAHTAIPTRPLGRSGLQVSQVALGCSGFWGNHRFAESAAERIVRRALERGVNLFDTGHNYSAFNAEPRLGRILQRAYASHPRDGLVISSKAGTLTGQAGISGAEHRDFSPANIERSCAASLRTNRSTARTPRSSSPGAGIHTVVLTTTPPSRTNAVNAANAAGSIGARLSTTSTGSVTASVTLVVV
jgi:hypothetical protein